MKKSITAITLMLLFSLSLQAQNIVLSVQGHVTDLSAGQSVNNHPVEIVIDSSFMGAYFYYNTVYTNNNGFYADTILLPPDLTAGYINLTTNDYCTNTYVTQTVPFNPGNYNLVANFDICQGGGDCQAAFIAYPDSSATYSIFFVNSSTGFYEYSFWEFGDGQTSALSNPTHAYNAPGTYLVCLTIWDSLGTCQDNYCDSVYVDGNPSGVDCENSFTYTNDSLTYTFTGEAYLNGIPVSNYVNFFWDFGDGTSGAGQNATHTFAQPNTFYEVCLTTYHYDSIPDTCVAVSCQDVWVGNDTINAFTISGTVYLQNQMHADMGEVRLIHFDTTGNNQAIIQTTDIDSAGMYVFTNVPSAAYYIQAELGIASAYYGQYLPTYHLSALHWQNANLVVPMPVAVYDIYMLPDSALASGIGGIHGIVEEESYRELMEDVEMLLLGPSNEPYSYQRTDENGAYAFDQLALGTYTIYAEIPGIETIPATIALDEDNPVQEVNILIRDGMAFLAVNEIQGQEMVEVGNLFPNPVARNAYIEINLASQTKVDISIMNLVGQRIWYQELLLPAGRQKVQINADDIPPGLYHLQIITHTGSKTSRKLIKY